VEDVVAVAAIVEVTAEAIVVTDAAIVINSLIVIKIITATRTPLWRLFYALMSGLEHLQLIDETN
jgi:hypothetical protein